jgi:hypothetical protein
MLPRGIALLMLFVCTSACNNEARQGQKSDGGGPCIEGQHQCSGRQWMVCQGGTLTAEKTCPSDQVCSDKLGCTPCFPGGSGCVGDKVVVCDASGSPTQTVTQDCNPLTCASDPATGQAACVTPCDPKALAQSYTGCVFFAVDLPQFTIPTPIINTIAANQQFAIAVANPWAVPLTVTVDRNDALPGQPQQVTTVVTKQVPAGGLETIALPQREVSGFEPGKRNRSLLTANAYRVTTDRPASVYQFNPINNPDAFSNDASLLIPQNALDESYVVLGWPGAGGDVSLGMLTIETDKRSYITITAARANTKVRVTPSTDVMAGDNVTAIKKGTPYTLTLHEFETLNLEGADFATSGMTDFTGTRIEADGPLAVWSGVECTTINPDPPPDPMKTCCCDHLEEQLFPRSSLGSNYVVARSASRNHSSGDPEYFRIMALTDGTTVNTSLAGANAAFTLNAGEMKQVMVNDDFIVQASKAIMIGQFQISQDSSAAGTGDPSFALVPPTAQHRSDYIFLVPSGYSENWMVMSIAAGGTVNLDGAPLSAGCERQSAGKIGSVVYDALRCPVPVGSHRVTSTSTFGLVVQGFGPGPVSYAYTGGMEFQSVNDDCINDGDCPIGEFCSGGTCTPDIVIQ